MENTFIPESDLRKYAGDWQAHLKLIADFLEPGEGVWWQSVDGGIEFFDGPNQVCFREEGPRLHHFRSCNIKKEQEHLDASWANCLESKVKIPATKLRNSEGRWHVPEICCSSKDIADDDEDDHVISVDQITQQITEERGDDNFLNDENDDDNTEPTTYTCSNREVVVEEQMGDHVQENDHEEGKLDAQPSGIRLGNMTEREDQMECEQQERTGVSTNQMQGKRPFPFSGTDTPEPKKKKATNEHIEPQIHSKTGKALIAVLGPTEEVTKFEKLRENLQKNPKSRYHIERYETHLVKIQIEVLKAFKEIKESIKTMKEPIQGDLANELHLAFSLYIFENNPS